MVLENCSAIEAHTIEYIYDLLSVLKKSNCNTAYQIHKICSVTAVIIDQKKVVLISY